MCVSHALCMYVPNTLHCTDYHPCLVPRAFYAIPILHILQFEEFFHLLVYTCTSNVAHSLAQNIAGTPIITNPFFTTEVQNEEYSQNGAKYDLT